MVGLVNLKCHRFKSVTAHGYSAGDLVYISGTTSYNGAYLINSVNTDDFNIPDTTIVEVQNLWGSTETGNVQRGDKDLSGLTGLTNVTTTVLGDITEYRISGTRIIVDGSLYLNARSERINFINVSALVSPTFYCNNSISYLAVVSRESVNGVDEVFPYQLAIDFGDSLAGFNAGGVGGISINNGSALLQGLFNFGDGSSLAGYRVFGNTSNVFKCDRLVIHDLADSENTQIRVAGTGTNSIDNCVFIGCSVTLALTAVFSSFSGNVVKQNNEGIVLNQNGAGGYQVFTDFEDNNANTLLRHNSNGNVQHAKFINYIGGAGITYTNNDAGSDFNRVVAIKKVDVTPVDESGSSLSASYYAIDTDSGNRGPDYTENSTSILWECSGDLEYTGTTSSASIDLVTAFANQGGVIDNRGENANGDITFNWFKYGRNFTTVRPSVLGIGSVSSSPVLLPDAQITEATKATVDAYTTLDNAQELYDRHSAYLEDNLSNGTYLEFFLTRTGTQIGASALNIEIDATAGSAFAYTGSKVTLKSSAYTGGFTTSGIITQLNGATISNLVLEGATWNAVQATWTGSADATTTVDVQATGTYDATGFTFDSATTLNNDTGGVVDIVITNGQQQPTVINGVGASTNFLNAGATVTFNNLTSANVQIIEDDTTTVAQRSTAQTGTLVYNTPDGSSGTWCYIINREGYQPIKGSYTADDGDVTVNATQSEKKLNDGSSMYQGTSSALLSVTTQADGSRMNLRIGDGAVSAQAIFDEVEVALMTQDGMTYVCNSGGEVSIALLPTGTFVFLETNVRVIRDNAGDSNSTINAFVQSTDGIVLDATNGSVQFVTPNTDVNIVSVNGTNTTDINDFKADVSNLDVAVSTRATPAQVATELATYDSPTRAELTSDINSVITEIDANETKIDALPTSAQIADAVWDEAYADHTTSGTYGKLIDNLRKANLAIDGSVTANPTTLSFDTDVADPTGTHNKQVLLFISGALTGQSRPILTFTNGANNTITLQEALTSSPSISDEFVILPYHVHSITEIQNGLATEANATTNTNSIITEIDANETKIDTVITNTNRVDALIEDSGGDRFAAKALETAPTAEMSEAELHTYLDSYTNKGNWMADVSALATQVSIDNLNDISTADIDTALATYDAPTLAEMTSAFTEIKGAGWTTTDTLEAIRDAITSGAITPNDVWTHVTRELTAGTKDSEIDAIKAKTDLIPADPATETTLADIKKNTNLIPATL
jgi:hypothetical protein